MMERIEESAQKPRKALSRMVDVLHDDDPLTESLDWAALGVPEDVIEEFRNVAQVIGDMMIYIYPKLNNSSINTLLFPLFTSP